MNVDMPLNKETKPNQTKPNKDDLTKKVNLIWDVQYYSEHNENYPSLLNELRLTDIL